MLYQLISSSSRQRATNLAKARPSPFFRLFGNWGEGGPSKLCQLFYQREFPCKSWHTTIDRLPLSAPIGQIFAKKKIIITISQLQWKCRVNTYKNGNNRTLIKLYCSQFLTRFLQPFADVVAFVSLTLLIYLTINLKYRLDVGCRMSPYLLLGC